MLLRFGLGLGLGVGLGGAELYGSEALWSRQIKGASSLMHTARLCPEHALQQDKIRYYTIRYDKYDKVKPFDEKRRDLKLGVLFSSHLFSSLLSSEG